MFQAGKSQGADKGQLRKGSKAAEHRAAERGDAQVDVVPCNFIAKRVGCSAVVMMRGLYMYYTDNIGDIAIYIIYRSCMFSMMCTMIYYKYIYIYIIYTYIHIKKHQN